MSKKKLRPLVETMYQGDVPAPTIHEKISSGHYNTKVTYPHRADYNVSESVQTKQLGVQDAKGFRPDDYRAAMKLYNEDNAKLLAEYKKDALAETGLTDHPRAEKAWDMAWDHAYSSGWEHNVLSELQDLADLLLDD